MTKLLYVEDNDDNVYMLKMRLELLGEFEVLTAEDGRGDARLPSRERPDIILMDLEMPVIDGWEATRRLKSTPTDPRHPDHRLCQRTHWPVNGIKRSPLGATSSTQSPSSWNVLLRPFGGFVR